MCSICDKHASLSNLWGDQAGFASHVGSPTARAGAFLMLDQVIDSSPMEFIRIDGFDGKSTDGMIGTGHQIVPPQVALIVVPDNVGGDTNTTATLTVGTPVISTTNTIGDQDFYKVTLQAGQRYEIGMYAKDAGPNGVAHGDCYVELYGPDGQLITSADGGASTVRNNINSGFDVLLVYTPKVTGTFYVNARAFDQDPVNGTDGDFVGDYELFVRLPESNYKPYYDVDSPLYAIDWGSQVDRTSRNPDGQEGPRITGNPYTGVGGNPYGIEGKNVITYYFAKQGEVFVNSDPAGDPLNAALTTTVAWGMEDWEKGAFRAAMNNFEAVADIVYVEVNTRNEADFVFITYNGTPEAGILGRMSPPNENAEGQAEFNRNGPGWTQEALVEGGFSFITLIHEFGHGHGLAHPHDNGGRSGIMRGVEPETGPGGTPEPFNYTHGDFSLNQGIYTMMSYESGWEESPYGQASTSAPYGWDAGPMAFDIAALQDKYGVNANYQGGNNTYVLKDVNAQGTFYKAIWDTGGIDSIEYVGSRNTVIDLRAATLRYEVGGGGFLSYAHGIHGGFTIANGVTIENAFGGSGDDSITGNAANNVLGGRGGSDLLSGLAGNDTYLITDIRARVIEAAGQGTDGVYSTVSYELSSGQHVEVLAANNAASMAGLMLVGNEIAQTISGTAGADTLIGNGGADVLIGRGGADNYVITDSSAWVYEQAGDGRDSVYVTVNHQLTAGQHVEALAANDATSTIGLVLVGNELAQDIAGTAGADTLIGNGGADVLIGRGGDDVYVIGDADSWIYELAGQGYDRAYATVNHSLRAGHHVEVLAANDASSTAGLVLIGNEFSQDMAGTAGGDTLNGGGGADTLLGRGGADNFAFTTTLGGGNVDRIYDFAAGSDKILIDDSVFAGVGGLGTLSAAAFFTGSAASSSSQRIIYDQATGALLFDADGSGAGAAIQFATVSAGLTLSASDFVVI